MVPALSCAVLKSTCLYQARLSPWVFVFIWRPVAQAFINCSKIRLCSSPHKESSPWFPYCYQYGRNWNSLFYALVAFTLMKWPTKGNSSYLNTGVWNLNHFLYSYHRTEYRFIKEKLNNLIKIYTSGLLVANTCTCICSWEVIGHYPVRVENQNAD